MQVTDNFTLEELINSETARAKKINNQPNLEQQKKLIRLITDLLQPIRDKWGKPIYINSGFRCPALNKAVGGAATSQHLTGDAADITSADNRGLWKVITEMIEKGEITVGQLIDEKNLKWIHISNPDARHRNQILKL